MNILAIDSSAVPSSVCLMTDGKIVSEFFLNNKLTHSQTLTKAIKTVLENSCVEIKDIDLFAVSTGPGSFTGLRIGVSLVKGMALPLNKKCVSMSTLEAVAYNFLETDFIVCAGMDARNNNVYNAFFEIEGKLVKRLTQDRLILIDDLVSEIKNYDKKVFFAGDGAALCYDRASKNSINVSLASELLRYQRASSVAVAAMEKFNKGEVIDSISLVPVYLRPYQVKTNFEKGVNVK